MLLFLLLVVQTNEHHIFAYFAVSLYLNAQVYAQCSCNMSDEEGSSSSWEIVSHYSFEPAAVVTEHSHIEPPAPALPADLPLPTLADRLPPLRVGGYFRGTWTDRQLPSLEQRVQEAIGVGHSVGAVLVGESSLLPQPRRWNRYVSKWWVVLEPRERFGIYKTWAQAQTFVKNERGQWVGICYAWQTKLEAETFIASVKATTGALWL